MRLRLFVALVLAAVAVLAAAYGWRAWQRDYTVTTREDGRAVAQVVAARLDGASQLKVSTLSGTVQSVATDVRGFGLLSSDHVVKAPFTVDYFVDLSRLSTRDMRWDERRHALLVTVPEVSVGRANVDESRATLVQTRGLFVTRGAANALSQKASAIAQTTAQRDAERPQRIIQARDYARAALSRFLATPLRAAGLRVDRVEVAFPSEHAARSERWDTSRSLAEIFAEP